MEPTAKKTQPMDIVDTTDSLEAVGACRSMKNFLFWVIFFSLLIPQMFFWLDRMDLIEKQSCPSCPTQKAACEKVCPKTSCDKSSVPLGLISLTATVPAAEPTEPAAVSVEPEKVAEAVVDETILLENETDYMPPETVETPQQPAEVVSQEPKEPFRISCRFAGVVVAVCNFLVLTGAILYCLCMLMCLKISLAGRLGGINHMTRAFFVSLLLVVVLIPWQRLLPGVLLGAVWLPGELICGGCEKAGASTFWKVLFYARFVGLWVVVMWLLFWAQIRSAKWAQATLRRLGIVR